MNITIFYNFTIYENHDQRILFLIRNFDSWDGRFDVRLVLISNRALKSRSRKEKKVVRHIELILKVVSQRSSHSVDFILYESHPRYNLRIT